MTRVILGDLRTGVRISDIPPLTLTWDATRNRAETIRVTVPLTDPDVQALDLRNTATPGKRYLAVIENDQFMAAGPVWAHTYNRDAGTLELTAAGMASYFDHRVILPALQPGATVTGADTVLVGFDLGTIAKKLLTQARAWTGGNVPVVFEADRAGTRTRTYLGVDLNIVGTVLDQLAQVQGGPDIEFRPRWSPDRLGVEWLFRSGTETKPRLKAATVHRWDAGVPESSVAGLTVTVDATQLTGAAFTSGGRSGDLALISRRETTALTDVGYPLFQTVDSTHTSVTVQGTLDAYGDETLRVGAAPTEFWSFRVRANETPRVGEYWVGDQAQIRVAGDPFIPDGTYQWTIAALSGDERGEWVTVKTSLPNYG